MKKRDRKQTTGGGLLRIAVYLPKEVYEALEKRAEEARRTISSTAALILEENLGIRQKKKS